MASYELLDPADEDALHGSRLLSVEDRYFKRLSRRLLAQDAPINVPPQAPPTPPPDASAVDEAAAVKAAEMHSSSQQRQQWLEATFFEFAAFESNVARVQFLLQSNERERERYSAEKDRILETAQNVRENNAHLHQQLRAAQETLAVRKQYDAQADEITKNPKLRPRDEQQAAIEKLQNEIAELEQESAEYAHTWAERREQFGKIVDEGMNMLRLIRDEKEEAERQEGMEVVEDPGSPKGTGSRASTPRPLDSGSTPLHTERAAENTFSNLKPSERTDLASSTRGSRAPSPTQLGTQLNDTPMEGLAEESSEEGEEHEEDQPTERMDTT